MAWIRTIRPEEATGRLAQSYAAALRRAGRVFGIVRAMSLTPETLDTSIELYRSVMHGERRISRRRRELLAVVVSVANDCHY